MKVSTWNTPGRAFEHSSQRFSVEEVRIFLAASSSEEGVSVVSRTIQEDGELCCLS